MFSTDNNVRHMISDRDLHDIADSYAYAYGIPEDDKEFMNRHVAASSYAKLPDEFIYYMIVVALLEGVIEDDDGMRDKDYLHNPLALDALLGTHIANASAPEALAFARCMLLLSYPECYTRGWLVRDAIEEDANSIAAGKASWDDIERITTLEQMLWRNFVAPAN